MSEKRKIKLEKGSALQSLLISIPVGLGLFLLILSVASVIVSGSNIAIENLKYFIYISLPVTSVITSVLSAVLNKQIKGMIAGLLASFCVVFIIACVIIFANTFQTAGSFLICAVLSVLIGLPGGIVGANLK